MLIVQIPRRSRKCKSGEEPFQPGTSYYSRLLRINQETFERADFCEACWKKESPLQEAISWRGEVPKKSPKEKAEEKLEGWLELFRRLIEEKSEKEAYLMALFLKRKKVLLERGALEGVSLFEREETEELFQVRPMKLTKDDIPLQEALSKKL